MRNHNEKLRDVARSVLPSKQRKGARDSLRNVKQKNRRQINRQLARIDSIDTYMDDPRVENLIFYPNADIGYIVDDRRGADKLSVMHWAEQRVKKEQITDPHDRYNFTKDVLPENLAGRHALTHIRTIEGFCDGTSTSFRSGCEEHSRPLYRYAKSKPEPSYDWLVEHFTKLLTTAGFHAELNRQIKQAHRVSHVRNVPGSFAPRNGRWGYQTETVFCAGCDRPRVLAGSHDVAAWVADVFFPHTNQYITHSWWRQGFSAIHYATTPYHQEWREVAKKFL